MQSKVENMTPKKARELLQNRSSKARLPPVDMCALVIKAWNNNRNGNSMKTLKWASSEEFPVAK